MVGNGFHSRVQTERKRIDIGSSPNCPVCATTSKNGSYLNTLLTTAVTSIFYNANLSEVVRYESHSSFFIHRYRHFVRPI